ncbi:LysR family transcriptional regulator [Pseudoalteromonas sp. KJ71-7]|uniref:LysR family transcriptional regulator n=1 Tax=Pseudoalteromonas sp. KJ71-7 TaxID=3391824 RepID=UPI0039AFC6AF
MNYDVDDLLVFLAVVEAGSFTVGAKRLGIPKANVSRKVSRLEQKLGVTLLERSTRSQNLTEVGTRFLTHCKRIREEIDLADATVSEILHSYKGTIRIGASVTIGQQIIKPVISSFLRKYPDINIELSLANHQVDLIEEGFDLLIRIGDLDDSRLIGKRLGSAQRKFYASPSYLKLNNEPKEIGELCNHHLLLMRMLGSDNKVELISKEKKEIVQLNPRLAVDDFSVVKQATIDGEGIALLPSYMCKKAISNAELINILPKWGMSDIDVYVLYPKHRAKIPKVKAFLNFTTDTFLKKLSH